MESSTETHSGTHELGVIRPASSNYDPKKQLFAADVLGKGWTSFYDMMPDTDTPFLHSTDGRKPLSLKQLKEFILKGSALRASPPCIFGQRSLRSPCSSDPPH
mmetsp:Transcript_14506/g.17338  ORF Transcript_14506/g.17338 Transcript_14506/m.17338 type:complete len:103 (+) Transcript_14506:242-550(+)